MLRRHTLVSSVYMALLGAGCGGTVPDANPATMYVVEMPHLSRELRRVDRAYDMVVDRLRPDSGTLRADTVFLQLAAAMGDTVKAVTSAIDTRALQYLLWRDGAVGQSIAREGNYVAMLIGGRGGDPEPELDQLFRRNGVFVLREEGDSYFSVDESRLAAAVYPFVTDATRDYMRLVALEQHQPYMAHEVVLIPWDSLAARIQRLDEMIVRHGSTPWSRALGQRRERYLDAYLNGGANTPVFDTSGVLLEEVRASLERFSAANQRTFSGRVVAGRLDTLQANEFRQLRGREQ